MEFGQLKYSICNPLDQWIVDRSYFKIAWTLFYLHSERRGKDPPGNKKLRRKWQRSFHVSERSNQMCGRSTEDLLFGRGAISRGSLLILIFQQICGNIKTENMRKN